MENYLAMQFDSLCLTPTDWSPTIGLWVIGLYSVFNTFKGIMNFSSIHFKALLPLMH